MSSNEMLTIQGLGVSFDGFKAVDDLNFLVDRNELRVVIGPNAVVRRAILDKDVVINDGATVGVDQDADRARGFTVTETGITVVGKGVVVS